MGSKDKDIVTSWTFRDGRDYVISLGISESSSELCIKITDRITAEEWSCSYDTEYVESLTQRTGSFKPFDVFVSMIKSAILKKSESVALELMNIDDLEVLRTHRQQSTTTIFSDWKSTMPGGNGKGTSSQHCYNNEKSQSNNSANSKKKYLIVTYVAEFDKVHYPIPLNYSGPPDPIIMQNNIKKLKTEVSALRHAKTALEEEVIFLKQSSKTAYPTPVDSHAKTADISNCNGPGPFRQQSHQEFEGGVDTTRYRHPDDDAKIPKLMSIIQKLEERLRSERGNFHVRLEKLGAENDFLRLKVERAEKYGIELKTEIHQLEKQVTSLNEALQQLQKEQELKENSRRQESTYTYRANGNNVRSTRNNNYESNYHRDVRGGRSAYSNDNCRNRCSSTESCRSCNNYRGRTTYSNKKADTTRRQEEYGRYGKSPIGLARTRSVSALSAVPQGRSRFPVNIIRSRSSSPARSPFDPTAYVTEKRMKQQRISELRLENIKNRIQNIDRSPSRSRSNSRESVATDKTFRTRRFVNTRCSFCGESCIGTCTMRANPLRAKPPHGNDGYRRSPGNSPGHRSVKTASGIRKANSVNMMLSDNHQESQQNRIGSKNREQSPSPIRNFRPIRPNPSDPGRKHYITGGHDTVETDDAGIHQPKIITQKTHKVSASAEGNVQPRLLLLPSKTPYNSLKYDLNRMKMKRNKTSSRDSVTKDKDKTSKRQSLEAKLSALQHYLTQKPTKSLKKR